MFQKGWTRFFCVLLVLAMFPLATTGCIGSFAAWGKVKEFNESASENRWLQELLFIVLHVVPVYPIAYTIDILIINAIEFWSGENPMMESRTIIGEDGAVATVTPIDADRLEVVIVNPDGSERSFQLERGDQAVSAYDAEGNLMVRAERQDGETQVVRGTE